MSRNGTVFACIRFSATARNLSSQRVRCTGLCVVDIGLECTREQEQSESPLVHILGKPVEIKRAICCCRLYPDRREMVPHSPSAGLPFSLHVSPNLNIIFSSLSQARLLPEELRGDSSTDIVLNAVACNHPSMKVPRY